MQFDSIEFVTLSRATINNASITNSTVSGGVPDAQGDTRTGGTLIGGNLTSGQITKGFITWTDAAGTKRRGGITAGDINADATSIVSVSRGEITGVTTGGSPTPTGVSGATTSATVVENAIVRNAVLVNVVVENLVTQTFNKNQSQIDLLTKQLTRIGGTLKPRIVGENDSETKTPTSPLEKAEQAVKDIEEKIAQQRQSINEAKERVATAERKELLANRNQFETELAAGTSDPDSYAAADLGSIDPVMQVSISVIGEGLIQLRGPIRGINEIRTMINQIDAPLGQVKIGLSTLQINGEHGDQMDEVATRMEGHIDLSRFLTNQSLQLLRRAIQEQSGQIVSQINNEYPRYRQIDRDRKYVYAFFGRDFIDELYEMDSEFLRTENKLLSLHAMDTVSLSQATFILALAKNNVRQNILANFLYLVQTELPGAEYDQRRMAGMLKKSRDISAIRRLIRIPGLPHNPDPKLAAYSEREARKFCKKACELYKFRNFVNFFTANVTSADAMTPMQRQFIRLAQIFKSQMIAEIELKQRIVERALIQDFGSDEAERQVAREQHAAKRNAYRSC